jgi:oligopeptide/dipeptide ABC transporter ATP-binding protein
MSHTGHMMTVTNHASTTTDSLLEVRDLVVQFRAPRGDRRARREPRVLRAVDHLDLDVQGGSSLGIVGESGCGKSTLARAIVGLVQPASGSILYGGDELPSERDRNSRRVIQMVFQDPGSSLNPRMKIGVMLAELIKAHRLGGADIEGRCEELMSLVGLPASVLDVTPRSLSGGQRQRIGIARALAVEPSLLIADEAVSALDVSVRASILNLLVKLQRELSLTLILISHDLAVVRNVCDRVAVMYVGRIVEEAATEQLFADPRHPYTRSLLSAVPHLHRRTLGLGLPLMGEAPSPLELPTGCRFRPRCAIAQSQCGTAEPNLIFAGDRSAACFFAFPDKQLHHPTTAD